MPKGVKGFQLGNTCRPKAPHTIEREKMREYVVEKVRQQLDSLLEAKFALAHGHYMEKEINGEKAIVYKTAPDGNAIQYLLNQSIGKPKETIEHQGLDFTFEDEQNS